MALEVTVVSPARPIFEGTATLVTVPTWKRVEDGGGFYGSGLAQGRVLSGVIGVLPGHSNMVAAIGSGLLRIVGDGATARFAVRGGFLQVGDDKVTILVDQAVLEADIDPAAAQADLDQARAGLRQPGGDDNFAELLEDRAWAQARLTLSGAAPAGGH